MNKSAPGISNVTYDEINHCDPECAMITLLFNKILEGGSTPIRRKQFYTLMIHKPKKDPYRDISSWRPIALLDCIYKLFTATITYQINEWTIKNDLNFPLQKGNGLYEGRLEHNLLLRCLMEDQKVSPKQELHICFLDIADAFGINYN